MTTYNKYEVLQKIGLITDPNDFQSQINLETLKDYDVNAIVEAYKEHIKHSPFQIKVSDIVGYWEKKTGQTAEQLEQRAALIYERYFRHIKGYDHVCADKRVVYAFKLAFGSIQSYGQRTNYIDAIDKKDFVKAYVNAVPEMYNMAGNVIKGYRHASGEKAPMVVAIGGEATKKIACQIYGDDVRFSDDVKTKPLLINKAPELSPLQRISNSKKVTELLSNFLQKAKV